MDSFVAAGNSSPRAADSLFAPWLHLICGKGPTGGSARHEVLLSFARGAGGLPPVVGDFEGGRTGLHLSETAQPAAEESSAKVGFSLCMSIWTGALVAWYLWLIGAIPGSEWPLYWLATSAIAIICNQQWSRES